MLPGLGLVVVAGPIAAALLAGIEGALAGTGQSGSLAGTHSSAGVFRRTGRSNTRITSREASFSSSSGRCRRSWPAHHLLAAHGPDDIDVYEPPAP